MADNLTYGNPSFTVKKETNELANPVVEHINKKFEDWRSARSTLEEYWIMWYRAWRCIQTREDAQRKSEKSQIKIPATKEAVNNAADALFDILFANRPYFRIAPQFVDLTGVAPEIAAKELDDRAKRAELIGKYIAYLHMREKYPSKVREAIIEMCIYGTVIGRIVARPVVNKALKKTRIEQPIKDDDGNILDMFQTDDVQKFEQRVVHPALQHIPIENCYVDPASTTIDDGEGLIIRSWVKDFKLRQLLKDGVIDVLPGEHVTPEFDEIRERKLNYFGLDIFTRDNDVELFEYWGWMEAEMLDKVGFKDYDKDVGGAEICAIVANKRWLLKLVKNPNYSGERPFVKAVFEKVPGEFYGIGIAEISQGPQAALDATVRSRMDNKALSINQMMGLNVDNFLPGQNLKTYPGKTFLFRGSPKDNLMPLVMPDITSGSYQESNEYERYIQSAHGISRMVGGMPAKRGEQTATEISMLMGGANTRLKVLVKTFEDDFVASALKWYTRIILQHMEDTEMFTIFDSQNGQVRYETITPEDIAGDFDFVPQGTTAINSQQEIQQRIQFLQLTANPMDIQFVNRKYLLKKVYEAFDFNDADIAMLQEPAPLPNPELAGGGQGSPPGAPKQQQPGTQLNQPSLPGGQPT